MHDPQPTSSSAPDTGEHGDERDAILGALDYLQQSVAAQSGGMVLICVGLQPRRHLMRVCYLPVSRFIAPCNSSNSGSRHTVNHIQSSEIAHLHFV